MDKLDKVFSEYIRLRDADDNGYVRCYCCGNPIHWTSAHAMHYINRWHLGTRFDERNVHAGCVVCNCYNSGNIEAYENHLIHEYGESIIDKLRMKKSIFYDKTDIDTKDMMKHYRKEIKETQKGKGIMKEQVIIGQPPSKSNSYRIITINGHGSLAKTAKLKEYEKSFYLQCNKYRNKAISGFFELYLDAYMSSQRPDLDNIFKVVLDMLQSCNAIANDRNCVKIVAQKFVDKKEPRIEFTIKEV